jgi:hypothetical protein
MKVKFLPAKEIETEALCLLDEYGRRFSPVTAPPVPVEEILECYLGLDLAFDDLVRRTGVPDVLGATWVQHRRVVVDQSLDPTLYPTKEGRYRFTVAHEAGHWRLHRHLFADSGAPTLFDPSLPPSIVCRTSQKDPMEFQADSFAAHLLMPREMAIHSWKATHGCLDPYVAADEIAELVAQHILADGQRPVISAAKAMAGTFKVSGLAMQIRLEELGLVLAEKPEPDLFSASGKGG